jgi:probable F420-dependent oxidoreductase
MQGWTAIDRSEFVSVANKDSSRDISLRAEKSVTGPKIPIGIVFPQTEIGSDPILMKDFAQAAESLGFSNLVVYDHVVGADRTNRPDWTATYDLDSMFQEPMVLCGFLAAMTKSIRLSTGVIILPQRQTVLFAKQAATLDIVSSGRFRAVVGLGWNKLEYDALALPFESRAARIDDQIRLLRRLWTERSISAKGTKGEAYELVEVGIWPHPIQQPIPIWVGGYSRASMKRAAHLGEGWFPIAAPEKAAETVGEFRQEIIKAGRNPSVVRFENVIFCREPTALQRNDKPQSVEKIAIIVDVWEKAGADGVCIDTMRLGNMDGKSHIALIEKVAAAIGIRSR